MRGRDVCKQHSGEPNVGRPTKLTEALQERVIEVLTAGRYLRDAATFTGVHEQTLYNWLTEGRADQAADKQTVYREFFEAVGRAA
jgi:transposase